MKAMMSTGARGLVILFLTFVLFACGQGDGHDHDHEPNAAATSTGKVAIGLTDAAGDFIHYSVDVKSLTLVRANGAVVETVPDATRVDFTEYTDLTEFLTIATVPLGAYTQATLLLDFTTADIQVENEAGEAVPVSDIKDADGNILTELTVTVQLKGRNKLVVAPGLLKHMTFDFDLKASNSVTFNSTGQPSIVVEPVLLADLEHTVPRIHRLRGALAEVDIAENMFSLYVHPFHRKLKAHKHFGELTVKVDDNTVYEIDGVSYSGIDGITMLDSLPDLSAIVVKGDLQPHKRRFIAREVYAGSSVAGGSLDVVVGNVVARSGALLTVKGATLHRKDGSVTFSDTFMVSISDQTSVRKQGMTEAADLADISVGQRIRAFGVLDNNVDPANLDATSGRVRLLLTTIRGTSLDASSLSTPLALNLDAISGRQVSLFNFAGTGKDSVSDADPGAYEVATGELSLAGIEVGDPVRIRGLVTPFGSAPADFKALSIVDLSDVSAVMHISWNMDAGIVLSSLTSTGFNLDVSNVGYFHHVAHAGSRIDIEGMQVGVTAEPEGTYILLNNMDSSSYESFVEFQTALQALLDSGNKILHVKAVGSFNSNTISFTGNQIIVKTVGD